VKPVLGEVLMKGLLLLMLSAGPEVVARDYIIELGVRASQVHYG